MFHPPVKVRRTKYTRFMAKDLLDSYPKVLTHLPLGSANTHRPASASTVSFNFHTKFTFLPQCLTRRTQTRSGVPSATKTTRATKITTPCNLAEEQEKQPLRASRLLRSCFGVSRAHGRLGSTRFTASPTRNCPVFAGSSRTCYPQCLGHLLTRKHGICKFIQIR